MSMNSSVECKTPFTDHILADMALSFSASDRICGGNEKCIIKNISKRYVPADITRRKKQAFLNPTHHYNDIVKQYFYEHQEEIINSAFFRYAFSKDFFNAVQTAGHQWMPFSDELIFKIVAINRFFEVWG